MTDNTTKLSERQRRFVGAFVGKAAGNGTKAAMLAGYSVTNARPQASRLLTKANIQTAVREVIKKREARGAMAAEERDRVLADIARNRDSDPMARLRAIDILNKCDARYSLKVNHSGRLTIEEALSCASALLRAPAQPTRGE